MYLLIVGALILSLLQTYGIMAVLILSHCMFPNCLYESRDNASGDNVDRRSAQLLSHHLVFVYLLTVF